MIWFAKKYSSWAENCRKTGSNIDDDFKLSKYTGPKREHVEKAILSRPGLQHLSSHNEYRFSFSHVLTVNKAILIEIKSVFDISRFNLLMTGK